MNFARIKMQDRPPLHKLKNKQSNSSFENREGKGEENGWLQQSKVEKLRHLQMTRRAYFYKET